MKKTFVLRILFITFTIFITVAIYIDHNYRYKKYLDEKIYDVDIQYKDKLFSSKEYVKNMLDLIILDGEFKNLYKQTLNNKNIDELNSIRTELFKILSPVYSYMSTRGILQLHFHLPNGDSFLRMHKPSKYGDNLLSFRESIKKVIQTKESVAGFEVGKYFDGFRYVFPIIIDKEYVGSVEASLSSQKFIKNMTKYLDGFYSMIIKKDIINKNMDDKNINEIYHESCFSKSYYMNNSIYDDAILKKDEIKAIAFEGEEKIKNGKAFVVSKYNNFSNVNLYTFYPIYNLKNSHVAYLVSIKKDENIILLTVDLMLKILIAVASLSIIFYYMRKNVLTMVFLEQFKEFVDKSTLVSKTDTKGRITYVNQSFEKLSGYSKDELIGKPHSYVRHPDMPKELFRDMWETIKKGKVWHGKIKNKKKNGSYYVVDANIFPIFDKKNNIIEYIALRHDITELEEYKEILQDQLSDKTASLEEKMHLIKQYEDAIDKSTALFRFSNDGLIVYVNSKMIEITQKEKSDFIDKPFMAKDYYNKNVSLQGEIKKQIKQTGTWNGVIECSRGSNGNCYLNSTVLPITDIKGNIKEFMGISYDITNEFKLIDEIEDTQKEVVFTMGAIGESRSKETGLHVKRVAEYSYLLAKLYGLSEKEAQLLKQSSPMHDIGKVAIPDDILNKPGKLTYQEFQLMKNHSTLGYDMLKHSKRDILKAASIVAYQHHEKWDGSGYPQGLDGENIHIYGRITAIADVFDALGHDRVYKKAWELEEILKLFEQQKGKHFDPKLIELFFDNLDIFLELKKAFDD